MDEKYLIANWKMNKLPVEVLAFFDKFIIDLRKYINEKKEKRDVLMKDINNLSLIFAVPFTNMFYANLYANEEKRIKIASQNVHHKDEGAYTGEISPLMLKSIDVLYSIVGHSERRAMGEKESDFVLKIEGLLKNNMIPIYCVGETKEEKAKNKTKEVLKKQIGEVLKEIQKTDVKDQMDKIIFAYEPVWAIGTGDFCKKEEANENITYIKEEIKKLGIENPKVLYGGSANSKNANEYIENTNIDGLLVGGASLDPTEFLNMYINILEKK